MSYKPKHYNKQVQINIQFRHFKNTKVQLIFISKHSTTICSKGIIMINSEKNSFQFADAFNLIPKPLLNVSK